MGDGLTAVRLVLADDEALVRQGLRLVLELDPQLQVVGEAANGEEAVSLARTHLPDLVLLDVRMPAVDGIAAASRITRDTSLAGTRVLMLTTFADEDLLVEAVRAGASGYLLKSMPPVEIRAAVHSTAAGQTSVAPLLVERLLQDYADRRTPRSARLDRLTDRETEVLRALAAGCSNSEIAARLFLGEGTVKTHVAAVLRKLEVRDRTQAAVAAFELGLVRPRG